MSLSKSAQVVESGCHMNMISDFPIDLACWKLAGKVANRDSMTAGFFDG